MSENICDSIDAINNEYIEQSTDDDIKERKSKKKVKKVNKKNDNNENDEDDAKSNTSNTSSSSTKTKKINEISKKKKKHILKKSNSDEDNDENNDEDKDENEDNDTQSTIENFDKIIQKTKLIATRKQQQNNNSSDNDEDKSSSIYTMSPTNINKNNEVVMNVIDTWNYTILQYKIFSAILKGDITKYKTLIENSKYSLHFSKMENVSIIKKIYVDIKKFASIIGLQLEAEKNPKKTSSGEKNVKKINTPISNSELLNQLRKNRTHV